MLLLGIMRAKKFFPVFSHALNNTHYNDINRYVVAHSMIRQRRNKFTVTENKKFKETDSINSAQSSQKS